MTEDKFVYNRKTCITRAHWSWGDYVIVQGRGGYCAFHRTGTVAGDVQIRSGRYSDGFGLVADAMVACYLHRECP